CSILRTPLPPISPLFPYTTLFRSLDLGLADEIIMVADRPAFAMVSRLACEEGILGGSSSGANVEAALQVAKKLGADKRVVTVIPDRKSTRLNSSHRTISYAVFCLK